MGSGFSGCVRQQSPNRSKDGEAIPFNNPSATVRNSNTGFALDLYRTLSENHADGNIFFSPLSISSALAMVYLGAKGNTAEQMAKTLCLDTATDVHSGFQKLSSNINKPSASCQLKLVNCLYGEETFNFFPEFIEATQKFYHAELKAMDFIGAAEESRAQINSWVEKKTDNKIKVMLKPEALSSMTRLVLVNAVYFKAQWISEFHEADTREQTFQVNENEKRQVQMMVQVKKLPYSYISQFKLQILELPYKGEELSMFFLLPADSNYPDQLLELGRVLTPERIHKWTRRQKMGTRTEVQVSIPKFKLQEDYQLNTPLASLGMVDVFDQDRADLSGMSAAMEDEDRLYLSTVAHKAFVEVNERGTEAGASTVADGIMYGLSNKHYFTADHPFIFFIRHNQTQSILFLGRFSSPEEGDREGRSL
ncbi:leukocyte elastase inhibitor-like [Salvelinus fontinalis]|uniref:leukocyte elastase inhibitor-like n=1 Tax=Salvelinus fontinalis TaxID=8038 RepID=UPI0024857343|nr:leukocyte elastase inhibitor-like [Salvelinus fontinalis]XP_055796735.1 leukocyte elastase inhibitor-like [Salvelinus fontinalis]